MSLTAYTCYYYYAPDLASLINKNQNLTYVAFYYPSLLQAIMLTAYTCYYYAPGLINKKI